MTVMVIAIMAIVAVFNSGMVALKRAADASTAATLADMQMEAYRAMPNCAIHLDPATLPDSAAYIGDPAWSSTQAPRPLRCSGRPAPSHRRQRRHG